MHTVNSGSKHIFGKKLILVIKYRGGNFFVFLYINQPSKKLMVQNVSNLLCYNDDSMRITTKRLLLLKYLEIAPGLFLSLN